MAIALTNNEKNKIDERRYDLDWLRVIAFALLIFYHIGMFYVSWGWHVKSVYAGPAAEPLMLTVNPWRLALLFFISGVAIRFASDKAKSAGSFARSRSLRLGVPILFGMVFVVAPQSYLELRQSGGIEPGYLNFWIDYLNLEQLFPMITPTWNHLWYVVYLLAYILLLMPFLPALRRFAEGRGGRWFAAGTKGPVRLVILIAIPFIGYELFLSPHFPTTHALWGDWANHAHRLTIFVIGYFAAKNATFWQSVDRTFPIALFLVCLIGIPTFLFNSFYPPQTPPWIALLPVAPAIEVAVSVIYAWCSILVLLGAAQRWLNRPSPLLRYLTGAVFCYYILHQTIIIIAGYTLTPLRIGPWPEFVSLVVITMICCGGGYEIARRIPGLRLAFGIKPALSGEPLTRRLAA